MWTVMHLKLLGSFLYCGVSKLCSDTADEIVRPAQMPSVTCRRVVHVPIAHMDFVIVTNLTGAAGLICSLAFLLSHSNAHQSVV